MRGGSLAGVGRWGVWGSCEATGLIGSRLFVLVFTLRETAVRIISLRKANTWEVKRYARQISEAA